MIQVWGTETQRDSACGNPGPPKKGGSMEENKKLDGELTKKEDAIIQTLEELTSAAQHLKELKNDLDDLISHHNSK